ncbi:hypothetical protein QR680_006464 [Steinernema hermaphroditum]|uniref:Uncharacterized protein n=1 Tax=Steinernema hermaphroditum TaxID=289476 RepID=A0AA39HX01_9BILA|nr:hypothetical protein QR680_006464 [Steinernema hermaphroditum]
MSSAESADLVEAAVNSTNKTLVAGTAIFSDNPPLQICVSLFNLANVAFVIVISLRIDNKDVSRLYTLWLYFANAPNDVLQVIISILQLVGLVDSSGAWYRHYIDYVQITGKFFSEIAASTYRTLACLLLTATFMCYAAPFSFARIFHPTRRNKLYMVGLLITVTHAISNNIQSVISIHSEILHEWIHDIWYFSNQGVTFFLSGLLFLSYVLAIVAIRGYANKAHVQTESKILHRKQLISVIIYATTPNLVVFNTVMANAFMMAIAINIPIPERTSDKPLIFIGSIFNRLYRFSTYARLPILTVSTFIAFAAYRRILLAAIPFRIAFTRIPVNLGIFPHNPPLQISISTFNLVNIVFVLFVSSKITRNDMSRLYTLWLYSVTAPSDCIQIVISILQIYGIVDSSGNYYRDYCDFVQMTGKIFNDIASHVYKTLCLLMLIATFMSYTFPFTSQKVFHPKRRHLLYLSGVIFAVFQLLNSNIHTIVVVSYIDQIDLNLVEIWYISIHVLQSIIVLLLILFYVLSIVVICREVKNDDDDNSRAVHRRQLISVIVYATMPNIIVIIGQVANVFFYIISMQPINDRTPDNGFIVKASFVSQVYRYAGYVS